MTRRHAIGNDTAGRGLRQDSSAAPALGRTMAFALDDGGDGGIRGIDDVALGELFALGQALRLFDDVPMRVADSCEVAPQTPALDLTEVGGQPFKGGR